MEHQEFDPKFPVKWIENHHARTVTSSPAVQKVFPPGISRMARSFHRQIPGYKMSSLKGLNNLAGMLGLGGIWVKDEAQRLSLNSFKVLGGSFAMYRFVQRKLGLENVEIPFAELTSAETRRKIGDIMFAAATDGNHGRGVAWAARAMGYKSIIYVHKMTSEARIKAIESNGAKVVVVDGTYDDAVRQVYEDSIKNGWQVISDTSWEGYEDIPAWVMQGYSTMLAEAQEQLAAQGITKPTHVFVQAGVGALAASTIGFYEQLFGIDRPVSVVVEPDSAACLYLSANMGDGKPHNFAGDLDTMMAGLACGEPSPTGLGYSVGLRRRLLGLPGIRRGEGHARLRCATEGRSVPDLRRIGCGVARRADVHHGAARTQGSARETAPEQRFPGAADQLGGQHRSEPLPPRGVGWRGACPSGVQGKVLVFRAGCKLTQGASS